MKTPFDVAKDICSKKTPWNEDIDKAWNTFMINRVLSMNRNYIELIDTIQRFYNIPNENIHQMYLEFIPNDPTYHKYIKPEDSSTKDLNLLKLHFGLSKRDARDYLKMMNEQEIETLRSLEDPKPYTSKKIK